MKCKAFSNSMLLLFFIAIFTSSCTRDAEFAPESPESKSLDQFFTEHEVLELDAAQLYREVSSIQKNSTIQLELKAGPTTTWELELHEDDLLTEDFHFGRPDDLTKVGQDQEIKIVGGNLPGERPNSSKLVISPEFVGGWIEEEGVVYHLEPVAMYNPEADLTKTVKYPESAMVAIDDGAGCGSEMPDVIPNEAPQAMDSMRAGKNSLPFKMEFWIHGDYHYYVNRSGSNLALARFALALTMANTEAKYRAIGIDFSIKGIWILRTIRENYCFGANFQEIFLRTADHWNTYYPLVNRDAVILFTGQHPYGTQLGWASFGNICRFYNQKSYAVVRAAAISGDTPNRIVNTTAHEIGHLLNARHPNNDPASAFWCNYPIYNRWEIMYSNVPGHASAGFSSCSRTQMNWHLWFNNACLR